MKIISLLGLALLAACGVAGAPERPAGGTTTNGVATGAIIGTM